MENELLCVDYLDIALPENVVSHVEMGYLTALGEVRSHLMDFPTFVVFFFS